MSRHANEAIYEDVQGWNVDLTGLASYNDAPQALKNYVTYLEKQLDVKMLNKIQNQLFELSIIDKKGTFAEIVNS